MPLLDEDLELRQVPWASVFLNPANPRLADVNDGGAIDDEGTTDPGVQAQLLQTLMERASADELVTHIKRNGFIPIDRMVVRPLTHDPDNYVVLEGNRRTAAVRSIMGNALTAASLSDDVRATLETLQVLVYTGNDPNASWLIQGFRNMGGTKDWGPYQQAQFLQVLHEEHPDWNLSRRAETAGTTAHKAGKLGRSLAGFNQAREHPVYGDFFTPSRFAIFNEAVFSGSHTLRNWLGWSETERRFTNEENLTTFLGLLVPNGDEIEPRIERVNPDLRDYFPRVLTGEPHVLHQFLVGGLSLAQAVGLVQEAPDPLALLDIDQLLQEMEGMHTRLQLIPIATVLEGGRGPEVRQRIQLLQHTLATQAHLLGDPPQPA